MTDSSGATGGSVDEQLAAVAAATRDLMANVLAVEPEMLSAFPLADDDVIIAGYPKSGTNWMQVIVANLWDDWGLGDDKKVPNMAGRGREGYGGYYACIHAPSPRLMKVHREREAAPHAWPEHGKVIHVTRNPKDVCVSYFHELRHLAKSAPEMGAMGGVEDMSFHVRRFVNGDVPWGPYVENVVSWRTFEHPNLLKITYEDARRDTRATVEAIVEFIGRPVEAGRIDRVVADTQFDAMRTSDLRFQINHPNLREDTDTPFMRKGVVGDWKDALNDADNALLDERIVRPLEHHGIHLTYE